MKNRGKMKYATGVYRILNSVNGKMYVGGAYVSLERRKKTHFDELRAGVHGNEHLQRAWDKYGEEVFAFEVLERCRPEDVENREQYWLDHYNPTDDAIGYNKSPTAGSSLGVRRSVEYKRKISRAFKTIWRDNPEYRSKIESHLKAMWQDDEFRRKMSDIHKRTWTDPEYRALMEEIKKEVMARRKASPNYEEFLEKMRTILNDPKAVAKRLEGIKAKWRDPEFRAKMMRVHKGRKNSAETRAKDVRIG